MKDFLMKNWYYLIAALIMVLSFIVSLIFALKRNKGKMNLLDSVKEALLENIPFWAVISENLVSGEDKKNNVISMGIALVSKMTGKKLSEEETNYFVSFISEHLEKVLAAPQKKMIVAKKAPAGKYRTGD